MIGCVQWDKKYALDEEENGRRVEDDKAWRHWTNLR